MAAKDTPSPVFRRRVSSPVSDDAAPVYRRRVQPAVSEEAPIIRRRAQSARYVPKTYKQEPKVDYPKPAPVEAPVYPKLETPYQEPEEYKPAAPPAYVPAKPQEVEYRESPYPGKPVYRPRPPTYQEPSAEPQYPRVAVKKQPAYKPAEPAPYKSSPYDEEEKKEVKCFVFFCFKFSI